MDHRARTLSSGKRIRAHANPLSDLDYEEPLSPEHVNVKAFYPTFLKDKDAEYPEITIADIGCGFAGLLVTLSKIYPDKLCLGLEIRGRVVEDDQARVLQLREQFAPGATGNSSSSAEESSSSSSSSSSASAEGDEQQRQAAKRQKVAESSAEPQDKQDEQGDKDNKEEQDKQQQQQQLVAASASEHPPFSNIWVMCSNAMRSMPNYFRKGQLEKLFFTFPDPHFKRTKYRRRIVNQSFLAQYAYVLKSGGLLYTITDVKDLHLWMAGHCDRFPLLQRLSEEEWREDPCVMAMALGTEEGQRVTKNRGHKYVAIYRRL